MAHFRFLALFLPALAAAQIEIAPEFLQGGNVRAAALALQTPVAAEQPLWRSLAGRQALSNRAHLVIRFAQRPDAAALARQGVRLLQPLDAASTWIAAVDLSQPIGLEMLAGQTAREQKQAAILAAAPVPDLAKLDPLTARDEAAPWAEGDYQLSYYADVDPVIARTELERLGVRILDEAPYFERFNIRLTDAASAKALARLDWVAFVEPVPMPAHSKDNADSANAIRVNEVQGPDFGLTGTGVNAQIIDSGSISQHSQLRERLTLVDRSLESFHSTHVAGTLAASGAGDERLKGMAPAARIFSWTFSGDTATKMLTGVNVHQTVISQNSWGEGYSEANGGCALYATYGTRERDIDRVVANERLAVFFAAGNERDLTDCSIPPRAGFYTIPRPSTAKNIVTVGAVDSTRAISDFSSYGPIRDGRVKPDLVAPGVNVRSLNGVAGNRILSGTSMSTPAVSGAAALLIERYRQKNENASPVPALTKAILLNSARDLGNPGPDYSYGYGLVDAVEAVRTVDDRRYAIAKMEAGGAAATREIEIPAGVKALRVMLAYSDADTVLTASSVITNHLDLAVTAPDGSTRYLPLRPDPANPAAEAKPQENARDTVKQVVIADPAAGKWTITVRGQLLTPEQEYALTWWAMAENPAPPCSFTLTPEVQVIPETGGTALVAVSHGSHCPAWQVENVPDWLTLTQKGERKGTDLVKAGVAANTGGEARQVSLRVGGKTVRVVQNFKCRPVDATLGATVESQLEGSDCYWEPEIPTYGKLFAFDASQGQAFFARAASGSIDTFIYLLGPNGAVLAANDDESFTSTNSRIPSSGNVILPLTGRYTLVVSSYGPLEVGRFTLEIQLTQGSRGAARPPVVLSGCPATHSGEITNDSSRYGRRGDLHPTNLYQFPGRVGQEVALEVSGARFDPFLYLISPSGRLVTTGTDNDGSGTARARAVLTEAGMWGVEVAPFTPFGRGSYTLKVEGCTQP